MRKTHQIFAVLLLGLGTVSTHAACYGSGAYQTCNDNAGNSYNVQRFGNTTQVQGTNAQTGSNWNQTTQTIRNTTFHNGTAADGSSWNGTSQNIGGTTFHRGTDSDGNAYSKTCNAHGCY